MRRLVGSIIIASALAGAAAATAAEPTAGPPLAGPRALVPPRQAPPPLPPARTAAPAPKAAAQPPAATPPAATPAAAATAAAPAAAAAASPYAGRALRVGVEGAYPPFSEMTPEGRIRGFDIDIANALCEQLGAKCLLVQQEQDRLTQDLLDRRTDMVVASLSMTDERRQRYGFTDKYYQAPAKFVARKGTEIRFDGPASLKGVPVGVQEGTAQASLLVDKYGGIVRIVRYPTLPDALAGLAQGEVALVLGDALALDLDFLKTPEGQDFAFVGPDLADPDWLGQGVGVAVRKDDATLREQLNRAIGQLRASGRYQSIARQYFAFDIYGGEAPPPQRPARAGPVALTPPTRDLPRLIDGTTSSNR